MHKRILAMILIIAVLVTTPALAASSKAKQVVYVAISQLGKPYSLLSDPPENFNCSTLIMYCYNSVKSGTISLNGINGKYKKIRKTSDLQLGDIVCYRISKGRTPNIMNYHFGIYCGNGYFIHASQNSGVIYSKVSQYSGTFLGGIRIF